MQAAKKLGITGSLSGWERYATDTSNSASGSKPDQYTLSEMLEDIQEITRTFDSKSLEKFKLLIEHHIHDEDNPHQTTLESMGTNVIIELYQEWLNRGYIGTKEDFTKILFQYVEIANNYVTREGLSSSKLVSVRGAKVVYDDHLVDPNAHDEMFRAIFPGKEYFANPDWTIHALVGQSPDLIVERDAPIFYHTPEGYLEETGPNTLPVDHLYGIPMFSIWEARTNLVRRSTNLGSGSFTGGYRITLSDIPSPLKEFDAITFREDISNTQNTHGWNSRSINFKANEVYSVSIYVMPKDRRYFTIHIPENLAGPNARIHRDLHDPNVQHKPVDYRDDINYNEMIVLPNGWIKVIHTFRALTNATEQIEFLFLDTIDANTTYVSTGVDAGHMWQAQIEKGIHASPPIITEEHEVERPGTFIKLPFREIFNQRFGTLVVETKQPYPITHGNRMNLYEIGNEDGVTMRGSYPTAHDRKLFMESFNTQDDELDNTWTGNVDRETTVYVHSYDQVKHIYGNTGNRPIENLVIDTSIRFQNALRHLINTLYPEIINDSSANTGLIEFDNELRPSPDTMERIIDYVDVPLPDNDEDNASFCEHLVNTVVPEVDESREENLSIIVDFARETNTIVNEPGMEIGDYIDLPPSDDVNTNASICDYLMGSIHTQALRTRENKDTLVIDFVQQNPKAITTLLADYYDYLYIGSNKNGNEQLNGYIKQISYYRNSCNFGNVEFHIGEYVNE